MALSEYKNPIGKTMSQDWSEHQLLAGISRGDEAAFGFLFDTYYQILVTFAYRYLGDLDASRDIVQDVFVMLHDKREEINIHTSLKAHLYQTVRNRALNVIKRDKMKREHHSRILAAQKEHGYYDEGLTVSELEGRISKIVEGLPAQCRKIFLMSRREGESNSEIAEQLVISKRTVETQISKALKKIREDLLKHGYLPLVGIAFIIISSVF